MNRRAAAGILAVCLTAAAAAAPSNSAGQGPGERVESGEIRGPGGTPEAYRIRLLPVDSFPALPSGVAGELRRLQCMIPQSFEAQTPENVIHGDFRAPGSDDWAALCSVRGTTTLYVFFAGAYGAPTALRSQPDTAWLGAEPGSAVLGSAWGIATRQAAELQAVTEPPLTVDHDGIEDARLERSLRVHYYAQGQWLVIGAESDE